MRRQVQKLGTRLLVVRLSIVVVRLRAARDVLDGIEASRLEERQVRG